MAFAGLGWLAFLLPAVPNYLSIAIKVIGFLAELSLCLWLLVMGVNVQRWKQQASPAKTSSRQESRCLQQKGEQPCAALRKNRQLLLD